MNVHHGNPSPFAHRLATKLPWWQRVWPQQNNADWAHQDQTNYKSFLCEYFTLAPTEHCWQSSPRTDLNYKSFLCEYFTLAPTEHCWQSSPRTDLNYNSFLREYFGPSRTLLTELTKIRRTTTASFVNTLLWPQQNTADRAHQEQTWTTTASFVNTLAPAEHCWWSSPRTDLNYNSFLREYFGPSRTLLTELTKNRLELQQLPSWILWPQQNTADGAHQDPTWTVGRRASFVNTLLWDFPWSWTFWFHGQAGTCSISFSTSPKFLSLRHLWLVSSESHLFCTHVLSHIKI